MPLTIALSGNGATASFQEFDGPNGTGNPVPPTGAVSFASDNPAVATVDPTSGAIKAVAVGSANISVTDAGNGLTNSDVLTVTDQAQSIVITLTANAGPPAPPTPQTAKVGAQQGH